MDQIRIVFQFLVEVEIGIRNIKAEVLWAVAGVQCGCAPLQAQVSVCDGGQTAVHHDFIFS